MATYTAPVSFEEYKQDYPDATAQGYQIYLEKRLEQDDINGTPTGIISYKNFKDSFLGKPNPPSESEIRAAYLNMREGHEATSSAAPVAAVVSNASKDRVPVEGYDPKTVTYNDQNLPTVFNYNSPKRPEELMGQEQQKVEDAKTTEFARNNNDETPQEGQSDQEKINAMTDDLKTFNNKYRPQSTSAASATLAAPINGQAISEQEAARRARERVDGQAASEREAARRAREKASGQARPTQAVTPARPTQAATPAKPTPAAQGQSDQFRRYHGTAFDPNSRLDKQKMQAMQGAGVKMNKSGMGPQKPATRRTLTAANMYDNPNRKFSKGR
jgi:hypothetical protein